MPSRKSIVQVSAVLIDQGLISLATFVGGALLARSVTPDAYGPFVLTLSVWTMAQALHTSLLCVPFTIQFPKLTPQERVTHGGSVLATTLILTILATSAFALLLRFISSPTSIWAEPSFLLAAASALSAILLRDACRALLLSQQRYAESLIASGLGCLVQIAIVATLYQEHMLGVAASVVAIACGNGATVIFGLLRNRDIFRVRLGRLVPDAVHATELRLWSLSASAIQALTSQAIPWLLAVTMKPQAVAIYGVYLAVANLPAPLLRGLQSFLLPRLSLAASEARQSMLVGQVQRVAKLLVWPYLIWFGVNVAFGDAMIAVIYSDRYVGELALLALLVFRSGIEGLGVPITNGVLASTGAKAVTTSGAAGLFALVATLPLAISSYGLPGAGMAALFSSCLVLALRTLTLRRSLGFSSTRSE